MENKSIDKKEQKCCCNHDKINENHHHHGESCGKHGSLEHGEKCSCSEGGEGAEKHSCACGGHEHHEHYHHDHHEHHGHHHHGHDHENGHCDEDSCGCGCGHDHDHGEKNSLAAWLVYGAGAILLLVAFLGEFEVIKRWLGVVVSLLVYGFFGKDTWLGAISDVKKGRLFTEFTLMCTATVGAMALLEFADAAAVMYLYSLGELIQGMAGKKSRENISGLIDITDEYINKVENRSIRRVAATEAVAGDVINVTVGERIPLDGVVLEGEGYVDTSAVTGESVPRELVRGSECLSGCVLVSGALTIRVTEVYENSTASKLKQAMELAAKRKAPTEKKIRKFAAFFTPCAFVASVLLFAVGWIIWGDVARALKTALVVLVVSCPCSLVLSVPLAYFAGMGRAAGRGIVFRGGEVIDAVASIGTVVFDKTGTLTSSKLDFDGVWMADASPLSKVQLLDVCRSALAKSPHAAAQSFCNVYEGKKLYRIEKVKNIGGKGMICTVNGTYAAFGNRSLMQDLGISVKKTKQTVIFVALGKELCGALLFRSKLKPEALPELARIRGNGVSRIAIMSGDTAAAVEEVAEALGVEEYYSELKPDEKLATLEKICFAEKKKDKKAIAFCGDGLNDAAAIARADVGFAMGSGSAVTVERADVVIVDDSVARVADAISIAKSTVKVANQNIVLSLGIKLLVVALSFMGLQSLELAIVADVGAAVLAVLNAVRAGTVK